MFMKGTTNRLEYDFDAARDVFKTKHVAQNIVSYSENRIVITGRKMGSSQLNNLAHQYGDMETLQFQNVYEGIKKYILTKEVPGSPAMAKVAQAFDKEDERKIILMVRDPFRKLLSAMTTILAIKFKQFKTAAKHDHELFEQLDSIVADSANKIIEEMDEELFTKTLRFAIKTLPDKFIGDNHVCSDYYINLLDFLFFMRLKAPHIFSRLILIDLDKYSEEPDSIQYLRTLQLYNKHDRKGRINSFADKSRFVSNVLFKDVNLDSTVYDLILKYDYMAYDLIYEHFGPLFYDIRHYGAKTVV